MEIRSNLTLEEAAPAAPKEAEAEAEALAAPAALAAEAAEAEAEAALAATEAAEAAPATLNVDLFQVLVGQINKLNKLLRKFVLSGLTVSVDRFHGLFPFWVKRVLFVRSKFPCATFCDWASMSRPQRKYSNYV
jgi:hypothetical protein